MARSPKRLAFVDDEPHILDMLDRMLHQSGEDWIAEFYLGADQALQALGQNSFDTVVTDIRMPEKDGFALIMAMQGNQTLRRIPIIVLTAESDRTLKRRVLDMGVADLLNKPVGREDLIARLRSALRIKEYEDQLNSRVDLLDGLVKERTEELERSHREVMWRLAKAGEFRDDQTGNHVARVAWYSYVLAKGAGMSSDDAELLLQASPLHDIGKIGVPDSILLKPGKLTLEERKVMECHTLIGENILRQTPKTVDLLKHIRTDLLLATENGESPRLLNMASTVARHHHEKWDGTGYPDGLAGVNIPLEARIVALADVYDALLSVRPYKQAMPKDEAQAVIRDQAGRHFDPELTQVFWACRDKFEDIHYRFSEFASCPVTQEQLS